MAVTTKSLIVTAQREARVKVNKPKLKLETMETPKSKMFLTANNLHQVLL